MRETTGGTTQHITLLCIFQSISPVWGTTSTADAAPTAEIVSIHVPRAGNGLGGYTGLTKLPDFNPRSPCGERRARPMQPQQQKSFQSTFPVRGTTLAVAPDLQSFRISIHVPRVGERRARPMQPQQQKSFQSTFPVRGTAVRTRCGRSLRVPPAALRIGISPSASALSFFQSAQR
jgi:hypothetical protein